MTAKQLTDSILQLAIQGKLVPQDSNDEPASVLLERIREEKRRLVKEKKLKPKDLDETPINLEEVPFDLPTGWQCASLATLSLDSADGPFGSKLKKEHYTEQKEVRIIQLSNIGEEGWKDANVKYTTNKHLETIKRSEAFAGDIIIAKMMPAGRAIICPSVDKKFVLSSDAVRFNFSDALYREYLYYAINSNVFRRQVYSEVQGITRVRTSLTKLRNYYIPIPPYNEQIRIVEFIKEALSFVKEYGEAYEEASKMDAELPDKLKKSILQEAIMGKLGTQKSDDEPASVLMDQIREEKERLVKEGVLKKKDLDGTPVNEEEEPFKVPESWIWVRLNNFFTITSGLSYKKDDLAIQSDEMVRVLRGGNISFGDWQTKPDDVLISSQFVDNSLLLKENTFITPAVSSLEHMGKTALIRTNQDNVVVGGFILMLSPIYPQPVLQEYFNILFQSYYYRKLCQSLTNKSGQAFYNLSRTKLLNAIIPLPPLEEQQRIVKKVKGLFAEIDNMTINKDINETEIEEI